MKIASILIAANNYPTKTDPVYTFLEQIAISIAKRGISVTIIAPSRIVQHYVRHTELHPLRREITVPGGANITVLQPRYLTFGARFERFNMRSAQRAVYATAKKIKIRPDICYGYFWHWGYSLYKYAKEKNIPLFVHTGETPVILQYFYDKEILSRFSNYVKGVVCNSSYCKKLSIDALLTNEDKCAIFPNAINMSVFYPRNKQDLRQKYGVDKDDFVVAFTGWFDDNKGSYRVSNAINKLSDSCIKSIFIGGSIGGNNKFEPDCQGIIFKGRVPHSEIPEWLSISDVFVLPTQHEGCSNGIIEAMACGLPVISSDRMFNWDVLNKHNSILIDPMNEDEIACAIRTLKDNKEKRRAMSEAALETAADLTIDKRVEKIMFFIESKL